MFFPDLLEAAELEPGAPNGLVPREPVAHVGIDLLLEVKAQFVIELLLDDVAPEERAQPEEEVAQHRDSRYTPSMTCETTALNFRQAEISDIQARAPAFGQLVVLRAAVVV